ncbi:MAG: zinc ABC transporter substrate-binding protein [Solobacterium sp.]|nr:zinc ABC transporter substrate-binding protein [Solobacterium sp.]MBQ9824549.1 zinc ABC transporter substrate-binding protein [Solobacterium sp.]
MKKKLICLFLTLTVMLMSGCASVRTGVAYTVYPIGWLIQRLAGNTVDAVSLQDQTTIVQRSTIRSDYETILSKYALLFHIGDLEPYLSVYSDEISSSGIQRVDLSTLNAVYQFKRYTQVVTDGEVSFIESDWYKGEEFSSIDMPTLDLYLWNDPIAMLSMGKDIANWLIRNYPENENLYRDNLEKLEADLINLDAQYQNLATSLLNNRQEIRFVSMTASFGNWQKTYGFQVYPVILSRYGVLPDEKQLEIIKSRIIQDDVRYIVYEPNMTDDMIELFDQLESELLLTRVELSNLSSLTESELAEGKEYLSLMYENLSVLETMKSASLNDPTRNMVPEEAGD